MTPASLTESVTGVHPSVDMDLDGVVVLIPAAGPVQESVIGLSNVASPAMIPVAGRPVIHWTLEYLLGLGLTRFRIGVPRPGLFLEELVDASFGGQAEVDYVVADPAGGVGDTIRALLPQGLASSYLVILGDTMFAFADPAAVLASPDPTVLVYDVDESYRWCIIHRNGEEVLGFDDKVPDLPGPLEALIGVYWFPAATALQHAVGPDMENEPLQLATILRKVAAEGRLKAIRAGSWLDCGNPDRQVEAQRTLLAQRAFNSIKVDPTLGTLTKRSTNKTKFVDEINYLRLLPSDLQPLFPRVLDFDVGWDDPHVTLEYYGYPTLAELFLFENVHHSLWQRVFSMLRDHVVGRFAAHSRPLPVGACRQMYFSKVLDRLNACDHAEVREMTKLDEVVVNGRILPGLNALLPRLDEAVTHLEITAVGSVIHGDLCFSNILHDLRTGLFKLLDPRGSFGQVGIHGDLRYDVAKLYHSVDGGYDFITADLFTLRGDPEHGYEFSLRRRPSHERIASAFASAFFDGGYPCFASDEVRLITALIFLGLPALHYDAPDRQIAFFLRGLQMATNALAALEAGR